MSVHENGIVVLERLRVASPCPARWEAMEGDDRVRFCQTCRKNVYNLSALQRSEAEALVARHEGKMCATVFRRADGTVLTADCPVGRRKARVRFVRRVTTAAAALFGLFGGQFFTARPRTPNLAVKVEQESQQTQERVHPKPRGALTPKEKEELRLLGSLGYSGPPVEPTDRNSTARGGPHRSQPPFLPVARVRA